MLIDQKPMPRGHHPGYPQATTCPQSQRRIIRSPRDLTLPKVTREDSLRSQHTGRFLQVAFRIAIIQRFLESARLQQQAHRPVQSHPVQFLATQLNDSRDDKSQEFPLSQSPSQPQNDALKRCPSSPHSGGPTPESNHSPHSLSRQRPTAPQAHRARSIGGKERSLCLGHQENVQ